jgi:hypothetical protein
LLVLTITTMCVPVTGILRGDFVQNSQIVIDGKPGEGLTFVPRAAPEAPADKGSKAGKGPQLLQV